MSSIRKTISVAANASIDDILVTEGIRLQQRTALLDGEFTIALTQSALGLSVDIIAANAIISSGTEPVVKSIAPVLPDDLSGSFMIRAQDQVSLGVRNTTGGAITLGLIIDVPG